MPPPPMTATASVETMWAAVVHESVAAA